MDYSFVTGESEPVARPVGSHLYAGGRQVGGAIEVETVKLVAQSYLASLWNNETFRKSRGNDLDSLTNRYSKRFTKLVIGVALAAAAFWIFRDPSKSLKAFISVLIVACPCALALAAPLTHGTAQRLLARLKIFLKNALVIERMAEVDTIVLDKTGTLTCADARGIEFAGSEPLSTDETEMIASLARHSTHPNSARIAKSLPLATLPVSHFKEILGSGIEGEINGRKIQIGSQAWLEQCGISVREGACPAKFNSGSAVFVAIDVVQRGVFRLEHSLRPEVEKLVAELGGCFELALLSGDNEREATRFQKIFGGEATMRFNQSPADKLNFIRELQQRGRKVMMVGDGLNDAGALKQAECWRGRRGAHRRLLSPASDVILDAAELPQLARVLQFSRRAALIVRTGFIISTCYNLVGVSIAAAGLLCSPIVCAILMPMSSITVVAFVSYSCDGVDGKNVAGWERD